MPEIYRVASDSNLSRQLPPGFSNAYWFAVFNALSFQLVLSSPMVLYAKSLGASATVLGIIVSLMPLLVIFQIPAAQYIPKVGFRRFIYAGWGTRVMFIFGVALVPVTGSFLSHGTQLALILLLLFGFNLSRGITSCAWMPWITSLVPEAIRGRYLARDAACVNVSSFFTFVMAAWCLGGEPQPYQFALLFLFSAIMGASSLNFLKKIPDVPVPADPGGSAGQVPWSAMLAFAPFRKLLVTVIFWAVAYGGMQAFPVAFLKSEAGLTEGRILLITSVSFLGGLGSLWFLGPRLDHLGSKPVLGFSFVVYLAVLGGWVALSGRAAAPSLPLLLSLQFLMGLFASLINMSATRLAMATVPVMGRNHFFALYSVGFNVTQGVAPICWGLLIDAIGVHHAPGLGLSWNRFSIFFAGVAVVLVGALIASRRLEEPKAASMEALMRDLLMQSPLKYWLRYWPRA
jgi:MFS family permease